LKNYTIFALEKFNSLSHGYSQSHIEALTHDGYFVQIPRVKGKPRTSLEKLLSVFEQRCFIDDKNTIKDYEYSLDDENLLEIVQTLRHAAADVKTRREMEEAWWAELTEKEYERLEKELEARNKIIEEKDKEIEKLKQRLKNSPK